MIWLLNNAASAAFCDLHQNLRQNLFFSIKLCTISEVDPLNARLLYAINGLFYDEIIA